MITDKLKDYLQKHNVHYEVIPHKTSYTMQETAQTAHIPGKELAKTVMIKVDGKPIMVVVPATSRVDLDHLKAVTRAKNVTILNEEEFKDLFGDCESGAMPPFGKLYKIEMLVDQSLAEDPYIAFNAGNHEELVKIKYSDYEKLVKPQIVALTRTVLA